MDAMPKYRPPFLMRSVSRHGQVRWYYRRGGKQIRLPAFGAPGFQEAYDAAAQGFAPEAPNKPTGGTLAWLVAEYKQSAAWLALKPATRKQRGNILAKVLANAGTAPYAAITGKTIRRGMEDRAATPFAARNFLETMRGLFAWAVEAEHLPADPTFGIKARKPKTEGFPPWTEADCAAYEARWPLGTRERPAYDILASTGLRRGDAAILGRQHVRDGLLTLRTEKTGEVVEIPVLPALAASIAACPTGDLTFVVSDLGTGYTKESFGNWFSGACRAAGVEKSAHGLRKLAATRLAEAGATVAQLEAWFGWRGGGMASLYTRKADRKRLANSAGGLLCHPVFDCATGAQVIEKKG